MKLSFGKEYKLCSKTILSNTYSKGRKLKKFPILIRVLSTELQENVAFQVAISVPKKKFKKAVQRNRIKRQLKEAIRKNKLLLENTLRKRNKQLALLVVYGHNEEIAFSKIEQKIKRLFTTLAEEIITKK